MPDAERRFGGASPPDLGANQEGHRPGDYLSVPVLARQAAIIVAEKNLPISGSRVRKLVRRFVLDGHTDIDLQTYILGYRDPVGETATGRVMRERGF